MYAFIDRAARAGREEAKTTRGGGTGKRGEGIRNHLGGMKNVAESRGGAYGEGEAGVTVVRLK